MPRAKFSPKIAENMKYFNVSSISVSKLVGPGDKRTLVGMRRQRDGIKAGAECPFISSEPVEYKEYFGT